MKREICSWLFMNNVGWHEDMETSNLFNRPFSELFLLASVLDVGVY